MYYLDTSLLVAALVNTEIASVRAQDWLEKRRFDSVFISEWTITELSSALSVKQRGGKINQNERSAALFAFNKLITESFTLLPVTGEHFRTAAKFADHYTLGVRSGDALHLAIASDHGATVCTLDRRLAEAGPVLGVSTRLL